MKNSREGEKLLACAGKTVELVSRARRIPEIAYNVIGQNSSVDKDRIVITAHIDTKIGTTGAMDNAKKNRLIHANIKKKYVMRRKRGIFAA